MENKEQNKNTTRFSGRMLDPPEADKVKMFFIKMYYLISRKKSK